jgi:DNA-binding MurR/RpiR family transcriptional regulator
MLQRLLEGGQNVLSDLSGQHLMILTDFDIDGLSCTRIAQEVQAFAVQFISITSHTEEELRRLVRSALEEEEQLRWALRVQQKRIDLLAIITNALVGHLRRDGKALSQLQHLHSASKVRDNREKSHEGVEQTSHSDAQFHTHVSTAFCM